MMLGSKGLNFSGKKTAIRVLDPFAERYEKTALLRLLVRRIGRIAAF